MIRQARPEEQAALQTLWLSSFADEEPCVALFVRSLCSYGCALVDAAEDALRAMLFLLPVRVQMSGASLPASYIYAAATRPDCRGQGRMTRLLAAAEERAASRGDVCVLLCPQTESLFAFYGARGYTGRIDRCSFLFSRPAERTSSMLPMRAISTRRWQAGRFWAGMAAMRSSSRKGDNCMCGSCFWAARRRIFSRRFGKNIRKP